MNIFVKYQFNETTWLTIKETLIEMFPDVDIDQIITDGKVINVDVAEKIEKMGIPIEILLPCAQMLGVVFRNKRSYQEELFIVKNQSTGEYLCKTKVDFFDNPNEPEVYYFSKNISEAIKYAYNHGVTAAKVTSAFNLGNRIELIPFIPEA